MAKYFQDLRFIVSSQLNGFTYCKFILIILFDINIFLVAVKCFQILLFVVFDTDEEYHVLLSTQIILTVRGDFYLDSSMRSL